MQAIITREQQNTLWRLQASLRMSRTELKNALKIDHVTLRRVLDSETPLIVSGKTFTAVNNFLIEQLSKD